MKIDKWHFSRLALAEQVLSLLESGLSSALVFFAPRRMGKTQFLRKDMQPLAQQQGWLAVYYSFLDATEQVNFEFSQYLQQAINNNQGSEHFLSRVNKVSGELLGLKLGINLDQQDGSQPNVKDMIAAIAEHGNVLLLLDEVQILGHNQGHQQFVAALRTALDMYKDQVKVIFTGSSRTGLQQMFSASQAPFFHFGQNLNFPNLDKQFTDHLCEVYADVTSKDLDKQELWQAFESLGYVPQLIRGAVERVALYPDLTIEQACQQIQHELIDVHDFKLLWQSFSMFEQLLIQHIAAGQGKLFSQSVRQEIAQQLGMKVISVSTVQSALRSLLRRQIVGRGLKLGEYFVEDAGLVSWLVDELAEQV